MAGTTDGNVTSQPAPRINVWLVGERRELDTVMAQFPTVDAAQRFVRAARSRPAGVLEIRNALGEVLQPAANDHRRSTLSLRRCEQ